MSASLAVGNKLRATIWTSDAEQASATTVYYNVTAVGGSPATDQDVASALDSAVAASVIALLNNNAQYRGIVLQKVFPLPVLADVVAGAAAFGTAGATALPKQTSGLISWYTAFARQAYRGRNYIPFPATADDASDGTPSAGYVTRLAALATALKGLTAIAAGGRTATIALSIYHRASNLSDQITASVSRGVWATQKRRGAYGRFNRAPI